MNILKDTECPEYVTVNPYVNHYLHTHMNPDVTSIGAWFSTNITDNIYTLDCPQTGDIYIIVIENKNYEAALEQIIHLLQLKGSIVCVNYNHIKDFYDCWVQDSIDDIYYYRLQLYTKKIYYV